MATRSSSATSLKARRSRRTPAQSPPRRESERAVNVSAIAIRRPVFTVMVTVALMVLGFMGLSRLGTDLFPDVTFPVVVVNVQYPGASPSEVEQLVSKPMEDAVVSLNGIDRMRTY